MKKFCEFMRQAFCEKKYPSSKRILGGVVIATVCFCTILICIKNPVNEYIRSIIEVEIISACSLLGISSVTSIWKQNKK